MIPCAETMQREALVQLFGGHRFLDYFQAQGQITRIYRNHNGGVCVDYFPVLPARIKTLRIVGRLDLS